MECMARQGGLQEQELLRPCPVGSRVLTQHSQGQAAQGNAHGTAPLRVVRVHAGQQAQAWGAQTEPTSAWAHGGGSSLEAAGIWGGSAAPWLGWVQ